MKRTSSRFFAGLGFLVSVINAEVLAQDSLITSVLSSGGSIVQDGSLIAVLGQPSPISPMGPQISGNDGLYGGFIYAADDAATYPSTLNLNTTVGFPSRDKAKDYLPTDYRLVGLPGAGNQSVTAFLSGEQGKDWQVYWDNGAAANYFVAYDGTDAFRFSTGRAFWILKKGALSINTTAPTAPLNASAAILITLQPGWNLITNPFTSSVAWSSILLQPANQSFTDSLWTYNGSFSRSSRFDPYFGYYFFNSTNLNTLTIPYSVYSASPAASPASDAGDWRVNIALSCGEFHEQSASFGISREASVGLDRFDARRPRAIAATPVVFFHRPAWDEHYSTFASDVRPEIEKAESWEFEVRAVKQQAAQLVFSGIERIPAPFEVFLVNQGNGSHVNLREDSLYAFTSAADILKFKVVVGKKEAVQEELNSTLPKEFVLGRNYPNPFNPSTTIPLAIPVHSEVKLKVYNILGEEVITLHDGALQAGRYWFDWDGRNQAGSHVASGVYVYRLSTSRGVHLTAKMILMK
jgi:hypothetical protein